MYTRKQHKLIRSCAIVHRVVWFVMLFGNSYSNRFLYFFKFKSFSKACLYLTLLFIRLRIGVRSTSYTHKQPRLTSARSALILLYKDIYLSHRQ